MRAVFIIPMTMELVHRALVVPLGASEETSNLQKYPHTNSLVQSAQAYKYRHILGLIHKTYSGGHCIALERLDGSAAVMI